MNLTSILKYPVREMNISHKQFLHAAMITAMCVELRKQMDVFSFTLIQVQVRRPGQSYALDKNYRYTSQINIIVLNFLLISRTIFYKRGFNHVE